MAADLDGKRTVVTGAGRGLGRAIAELFVERGARVLVTDVDEEAAQQTASDLGDAAVAARTDVTSSDEVRDMIALAVERFGGLDVLVNNAGIEIGKPLHETGDDEFRRLMDINVNGVFYGIKHAVPALAQTQGNIVNMSSVAGIGGAPLLGAYCASKAAVVNLTRVAAIELKAVGIRVNCVCPAFIDTAMVERLVSPFEAAVQMPFGDVVAVKQGRMGTATEVAEMTAFLASDDASFTTGAQYVLDNGLTGSML
jgi:NAD(P)-dependent dehydrogenase (short-subunit alcohol dehydrogenase family)